MKLKTKQNHPTTKHFPSTKSLKRERRRSACASGFDLVFHHSFTISLAWKHNVIMTIKAKKPYVTTLLYLTGHSRLIMTHNTPCPSYIPNQT